MKYLDAIKFKSENESLIGSLSKGEQVYCIAIVPSDGESRKTFFRNFINNGMDEMTAIKPFVNSEVEVWALSGKEYLKADNVLFYDVLKK